MEVIPILQVASPPLAVALWVIFQLIHTRMNGNRKEPDGQVTERLCMARRGETAAKLGAIEDKLDTAIELIKNGGKS